MLNYEFPPLGGGAANANYYLLKEFAKKNDVLIDLVTSSPNNRFEVERFSKNIRIFKVNVKKKGFHYWKFKEILRWTIKAYFLSKKLSNRNKYDLCHCWFGWPSGIIGYLLRKRFPYIVALRGSDVPGYSARLKKLDKFIFRPLSKRIWRRARFVIANSEGLKRLALKTLNRQIGVIYNGVDTDKFKPVKNKKVNKRKIIISTGRLIQRKGYGYLIKALQGLKDKFRVVLIGDGNLTAELANLAERLDVDVDFQGRKNQDQIIKEFESADIFALPSLNEGMSNSVLEAMACGLPIIATDVGGSKELVKGNGIIIKPGSVAELRKALLELKNLKSMGSKSRSLAEKMSWRNVGKEYLLRYKNCVE